MSKHFRLFHLLAMLNAAALLRATACLRVLRPKRSYDSPPFTLMAIAPGQGSIRPRRRIASITAGLAQRTVIRESE